MRLRFQRPLGGRFDWYQCIELPGVVWKLDEVRTVPDEVGARIMRDHPDSFAEDKPKPKRKTRSKTRSKAE